MEIPSVFVSKDSEGFEKVSDVLDYFKKFMSAITNEYKIEDIEHYYKIKIGSLKKFKQTIKSLYKSKLSFHYTKLRETSDSDEEDSYLTVHIYISKKQEGFEKETDILDYVNKLVSAITKNYKIETDTDSHYYGLYISSARRYKEIEKSLSKTKLSYDSYDVIVSSSESDSPSESEEDGNTEVPPIFVSKNFEEFENASDYLDFVHFVLSSVTEEYKLEDTEHSYKVTMDSLKNYKKAIKALTKQTTSFHTL